MDSISFESVGAELQKLRERLSKMTDDELIKFGNQVRKSAGPRVIPVPDPWKIQLDLVREEWRRRHPLP
jgi:hypothetical protein